MSKSLYSRHVVISMFNRVASSYDFVNRLLSFGIDKIWRRRILRFLPKNQDAIFVDLATGTADQIIALRKRKQVKFVGFDLSENMLLVGQKKIQNLKLTGQVSLKLGNALHIPLPDKSADFISISFGIRNVEDPLKCLQEMKRCLKKGGKAFILEFSLPKLAPVRFCYLLYLRHLLPRIGSFLSKDQMAYSYLGKTIESFPKNEAFLSLMEKAGFSANKQIAMTFGVVALYVGES